jgi:hypothetical protein
MIDMIRLQLKRKKKVGKADQNTKKKVRARKLYGVHNAKLNLHCKKNYE